MPWRKASTRLFVQCLVVVQTHTINAEQFGSDASKPFRENELFDFVAVIAQGSRLNESFSVRVSLFNWSFVPTTFHRCFVDGVFVHSDFVSTCKVAHNAMT
jgi:hypothetical protein